MQSALHGLSYHHKIAMKFNRRQGSSNFENESPSCHAFLQRQQLYHDATMRTRLPLLRRLLAVLWGFGDVGVASAVVNDSARVLSYLPG